MATTKYRMLIMKKFEEKYDLPEVFLSDRAASASVSRMVKNGTARKIGPRLYTRNMQNAPEMIVFRNLWRIVALLVLGTVVSHRTAFENRPAPDGSVFLSGSYPRQITLSSITLRQTVGSGPAALPPLRLGDAGGPRRCRRRAV